MQNYTEIGGQAVVKDSRTLINQNFETIQSNNSGSGFPTNYLFAGMKCYRSDTKHTYTLVDVDKQTWVDDASADTAKIADRAVADKNGNDLFSTYAPLSSPKFIGTPTAPTAPVGTNDLTIATTAFVQAVVTALVNSSPAALDTLKELADALGDDPNFAATMTNALAGKLSTSASCNRNWNWNGQSGQPDWLWGGNDGGNGKDLYVWKPSNFDVHSAQYIRPLSGDGNYKLAYTADGQRTNAGEWGRVVMRYDPNGQTYGVRVDRADYADSAGSAGNSNQLGGSTLAQVLAQINAGNTGGIIAASFGGNGYVKWSNGFILQWGTGTWIGTDNTITFPIAFSAACYDVLTQVEWDNDWDSNYSTNRTTVNFNFHKHQDRSTTNSWVAFGH